MDGRVLSEDDLDEYEYSEDDAKHKNVKNQNTFANKPYDEAYEFSQDLSMAESYEAKEKIATRTDSNKERQLKNDRYDEALDASSSMEHEAPAHSSSKSKGRDEYEEKSTKSIGHLSKQSSKAQSISNRPFDEAYEMSQSTSEDSVDTHGEHNNKHQESKKSNDNDSRKEFMSNPGGMSGKSAGMNAGNNNMNNTNMNNANMNNANMNNANQYHHVHQGPIQSLPTQSKSPDGRMKIDESSDGEHEESYDNVEGAYNPKDYSRLGVSSDIKDLFQYIERYKPHEVELESSLKCFIPEYMPAIGEIDSFVKVPRPDGKEDDLGFKVLDEPSTVQSDPSVLELQLKSMSKKLQYGDVAVRSIENAAKNPAAIDKWIQNVSELHRTKPPPHVTYKKNMPDTEKLMEAWPEEFEAALKQYPLPSPDLDLSLSEYARVVCAMLDIPVYDNPIESLHMLFTLYSDFRNNPHFQARLAGDYKAESKNEYGDADVLEIDPGYK